MELQFILIGIALSNLGLLVVSFVQQIRINADLYRGLEHHNRRLRQLEGPRPRR